MSGLGPVDSAIVTRIAKSTGKMIDRALHRVSNRLDVIPYDIPQIVGGSAILAGAGSLTARILRAEMMGLAGINRSNSAPEIAIDVADIVAVGAWTRQDIAWSEVEGGATQPGSFNWTNIDLIIQEYVDAGLQIIGLLTYSPQWANGGQSDDHYGVAPGYEGDFGVYCAAVVNRYKPGGTLGYTEAQGIRHWEIWNEPNSPAFWKPHADPQQYTSILLLAYLFIHVADPLAMVLTGGTSPMATNAPTPYSNVYGTTYNSGAATSFSPFDWYSEVFNRGAVQGAGAVVYFDAIAHHGYWQINGPLWNPSTPNWNAFYQVTLSLVYLAISAGVPADRLGIWLTEYGVQTDPPIIGGPDYDLAAQQITDATDWWFDPANALFAGPLVWYNTRDSNGEGYGIKTAGGVKKAAAIEMFARLQAAGQLAETRNSRPRITS